MKNTITKTHVQRTKAFARGMDNKYGMAILKFDGERTFISGNSKAKLNRYVKNPLEAGDIKKVKLVLAGKPPKRKR